MIYHITSSQAWQEAQKLGEYKAHSLETEGFIHCSTEEQVIKVANAFYQGQSNLIVLCIDPKKLTSPLKWEEPAHLSTDSQPIVSPQEKFPHVYGAINLDAVIGTIPLIASANGFSWTI